MTFMPTTPPQPKPSACSMTNERRTPLPAEQSQEHEQALASDMPNIYRETGESNLEMTRLVQVRHSTIKKVLVGMTVFFAVLAAVSWAGVLFFSPGRTVGFGGEGVAVNIEGPSEVKSGELVT